MKKRVYLFLIVLLSFMALPIDTGAKTIKEFEQEVAKYTSELQEKKDKLAKNNAEVAEIRAKIKQIEAQIKEAEDNIEKLQIEIEESNKKIEEKDKESKKLMKYFQVVTNDNAYLEYVFGATSIKDMIYRMSVVEQLTEYNDQVMADLEALIKENNRKQEELRKQEEELKTLQISLQEQKARIDADSAAIRETMPSIETQIKEAKSNVEYFKKLGCGATEDILSCQYRVSQNSSGSSLPSVGTFARPMQNGYVTRGFTGKYGHMGYDLGSNNKTIAIYPIASGSIHAIYEDGCTGARWCQNMGFSCNGNAKIIVVKHNYQGGYIYSSYVHLSSYAGVGVGQYVTKDTVIGYMGTTGCSTGPHLHLEITRCHWKNNGGCTYDTYVNRLINPSSLITFPSTWFNR